MSETRDSLSKKVDITIGIPCYNEGERVVSSILSNIESVKKTGLKYEIIVIDDCSHDNSAELVRLLCSKHPDLPVTLHVNECNKGLAYNFVEAAILGTGKYYRMSCGDDSQTVEGLDAVFKHAGQCDLVVPYMTDYGKRGLMRDWISITFTAIVNFLSGYKFRYYNGCPIYQRIHVVRWHPSSYGFGYSANMIVRVLDYEKITYMQVPTWAVEKKGHSSTSLTLRNFVSVIHSLLDISICRIRRILYGRISSAPKEVF
jgi:glycosyltransferase involved in cell wall biosynthesis